MNKMAGIGTVLNIIGTLSMCVVTGIVTSVLLMMLVLFLSRPAWASEHELPRVELNTASQGSLLFRQETEPSLYVAAPTLKTDVSMKVAGMLAYVRVEQTFSNSTNDWQEGLYVFPLPDESAVNRLMMQVGDRIIEGQVKEKQQARKTYEQAKRQGRKAALVEQQRPNMFTNAVANIGPGESVTVVIHYQQRLVYRDGKFSLRFPMIVNPRYTPSPDRAVADAITQSGDLVEYMASGWAVSTYPAQDTISIEPGHPVTIDIDLEAGFPVDFVKSLYHAIDHEVVDSHHRVKLASSNVPADRDFVLTWKPTLGQSPQAAVFSEHAIDSSYALVMFMPPHNRVTSRVRQPRELIFVIDTSGSMGGASIRQAKQALVTALDRLSGDDRFNVIEFNFVTNRLFSQSVPASKGNISRAIGYVRSLQAGGGTEMIPALSAALEDPAGNDSNRVRQVVFMTDGSVSNEEELYGMVKRQLGRTRLFTVGIGSAPNSYFMQRAANFGRGTYSYIGDISEVDEKMTELFERIEQPVLSDIKLEWLANGQVNEAVEYYPARITDLYAREPLVISAKLPANIDRLRITGLAGQHPWRRELNMHRGATGEKGAGVARRWARDKITALMNSLHEGADNEQVKQAVIKVALNHHLVSHYTSLVAVDVTPSRPASSILTTGRVSTPLPKGSDPETFIGLPQTATPATMQALAGFIALVIGMVLAWYGVRTGRPQL